MTPSSPRRTTRHRSPLVTRLVAAYVAALAVLATGAAWTPAAAADQATIDHAQPVDGAVRLLVSVPGTETVDLDSVTVKIAGEDVASEAASAATTDDVERTSILAIDTSNSMRGTRITEAKKAATTYLTSVPANVKVGVLTFDDQVRLVVPPTTEREPARAAIEGLTLSRNTALYDGVLGALDAAGPGGEKAGQRKILVLSDGKDTTDTALPSVLGAIKKSGASVDVVSLQQGDEGNKPLNDIATAGKGVVIDTQDPAALTAAFASEADVLARQIVVTAEVPDGSSQSSANVAVAVSAGAQQFTASAYVPVRPAKAPAAEEEQAAPPQPVTAGRFAIPENVMFGGVAAMGLGLVGVIIVLALGSAPRPTKGSALSDQMRAYGANAAEVGRPTARQQAEQMSFADQARQAAQKALSNNKSLEARIEQRLEAAGMSLKPAEWLLVHGGIAVGAGLVGVLVGAGNILLGLVFLVFGAVGPWVYLGLKKARRLKAFGSHLADTLQLMSGSLSAGLSLAQSIDTIVREGSEPITSEFRRVVVESRLGVTVEDALEGVAGRMESKDFSWVVMAIRIQREVGGNLAELLNSVADTLRERDYLRRHVKALSAEGRLSCYILGGLPPGFLLYLTVTKPDYVNPMYTTPIGWVLCAGMGVLLAVGIFWMTKVAKVEL